MNQPQSAVIASRGCHTGKTVGRVANTPQLDQSLLFPPSSTGKRHELTPEEAKEGFIMGVTKHMVLHFPRRSPDGYTERLYSCEPRRSHYVTTGLLLPWGGLWMTTPKHWNRTAPQHSTGTAPESKGWRVNHRPKSTDTQPRANHTDSLQAWGELLSMIVFTNFPHLND